MGSPSAGREESMNGKERVQAAIARQPVDKVPLGLYAVDHDTVAQVIGRPTIVRNQIEMQIACWEGRHQEMADQWKTDLTDFFRKIDCADVITCREAMLMSPKNEDVLPVDPQRERLKSFVGQTAYTKCKMMPGGAIIVDGRTVDAVSQGMSIEAGQPVRVIEVTAHRVVVRPLSDEEVSATATDPMRRPIDTVVPDPFEEPPFEEPPFQEPQG